MPLNRALQPTGITNLAVWQPDRAVTFCPRRARTSTRALASAGCDVNAKDQQGLTGRDYAKKDGSDKVLHMLNQLRALIDRSSATPQGASVRSLPCIAISVTTALRDCSPLIP